MNSNLVHPTFNWPEQRLAAGILNTWMNAFVDKAADLRLANLQQNAERIAKQRETAKDQLLAAQTKLQAYRTTTIIRPNESTGPSAAAAGGGSSEVLAGEFQQSKRAYTLMNQDRIAFEQLAASGTHRIRRRDQRHHVGLAVPTTPKKRSAISSRRKPMCVS